MVLIREEKPVTNDLVVLSLKKSSFPGLRGLQVLHAATPKKKSDVQDPECDLPEGAWPQESGLHCGWRQGLQQGIHWYLCQKHLP
jgi:hypothetical protein